MPAASAFVSMLPFQPPLPIAWNLPFQPAAGSHTSILMSESADGLSVAATRQNAGRSVNCAAAAASARRRRERAGRDRLRHA